MSKSTSKLLIITNQQITSVTALIYMKGLTAQTNLLSQAKMTVNWKVAVMITRQVVFLIAFTGEIDKVSHGYAVIIVFLLIIAWLTAFAYRLWKIYKPESDGWKFSADISNE